MVNKLCLFQFEHGRVGSPQRMVRQPQYLDATSEQNHTSYQQRGMHTQTFACEDRSLKYTFNILNHTLINLKFSSILLDDCGLVHFHTLIVKDFVDY